MSGYKRRAEVIKSDYQDGGSVSLDKDNREAQLEWCGKGTEYFTPIPPGQEKIMVYRTVPKEFAHLGILDGNYVSQSKKYAVMHSDRILFGTKNELLSKEVYLDELFVADGPNEFFYVSREYLNSQDEEG
jgi:hypothetical protein